jgi:chromate transporter
MAIHVGRRRAGSAGLLVAGVCFIVPAVVMVMASAAAYVRFGSVPRVQGLLYGIKPVVIAIVIQALWGLGRVALRTRFLTIVASAALAANLLGVNELAVLFAAGLTAAFWQTRGSRALMSVAAVGGTAAVPVAATVPFGLWPLFSTFLKIGSVLFGSGYVLLAFVRADFVERLGWLSEAQLLDAVAVGQITPGPLFTTATFIGYVLGGPFAALVATAGIFLPAFVFVALSGPLIPRLRQSRLAGAILDGVNVASLALMAAVALQLGRAAIVDLFTAALALVAALVLLRSRISSAWLVLAGGVAGAVMAPTIH